MQQDFVIEDVHGEMFGSFTLHPRLVDYMVHGLTFEVSAVTNLEGRLLRLNIIPQQAEEITDDYKRGLRDGHTEQAKISEERMTYLESEVKRLEEHLSPTHVDRKKLIKNAQAQKTN